MPKRVRTSDLQFRKLTLYPAELWAHFFMKTSGAKPEDFRYGEGGIRTPGAVTRTTP